jgi:hypothetical protein
MKNRRVDITRILADSDLRRRLMISTIQATQAREGIQTSAAQASRAYYVVTEGEKTAFFDLDQFKRSKESLDRRHEMFVQALLNHLPTVRFDVARRDFAAIDDAPMAYRRIGLVAELYKSFPALGSIAEMWQGVITRADEQYIRYFWEVKPAAESRPWKTLNKGGEFSRFYFDAQLVIDWSQKAQGEFHRLRDTSIYFRRGLTWPRRTAKGLNVRRLPPDCVFSDKGPALFLKDDGLEDFVLGVVNTGLFEFVFKSKTSFSWEIGIMKTMPIPPGTQSQREAIGSLAAGIFDAKAVWDEGNETSTRFTVPWLLRDAIERGLVGQLDAVLALEQAEDTRVRQLYESLNKEVYQLYELREGAQETIKEVLGERPLEIVWPQMEGKTRDQKRMEHVWRLLSFSVKRVVETGEDGLVPFLPVSDEASLLDRVRTELASVLSQRDINEVEVEIANELKRKVKGYERAESIREWLENVYFAYHASLYKNRPIFWHISSKQGKGPAAFAALVHYHRFDKDRLAKLRGVYLREALGVFRREAALAGQQGRADDRLEWQAKVEEAEELDRRLQRVQEGFHHGTEDYRILTPWKSEKERPKGWDPDINDGVKVNIEPLQRAGVLRIPEVV